MTNKQAAAEVERLTRIAYSHRLAIAQAEAKVNKLSGRNKTAGEWVAEADAIRLPAFRAMVRDILAALGLDGEGTTMKCPTCVTEGETSTVQVGSMSTTAMASNVFYDEDGKCHQHNPNKRSTDYSCSRGHRWTETGIQSCWCGWPEKEG